MVRWLASLLFAIQSPFVLANAPVENAPGPRPSVHSFNIDLSDGVPHMRHLVRTTFLPRWPEFPGIGDSAGIGLDVLKSLRLEWLQNFDWQKEEDEMNWQVDSRGQHTRPMSFC